MGKIYPTNFIRDRWWWQSRARIRNLSTGWPRTRQNCGNGNWTLVEVISTRQQSVAELAVHERWWAFASRRRIMMRWIHNVARIACRRKYSLLVLLMKFGTRKFLKDKEGFSTEGCMWPFELRLFIKITIVFGLIYVGRRTQNLRLGMNTGRLIQGPICTRTQLHSGCQLHVRLPEQSTLPTPFPKTLTWNRNNFCGDFLCIWVAQWVSVGREF